METPNYFLFAPDPPECFRWTQKGREVLGPRFARQGIAIDALRTADDIEDAVTGVIQAELAELTPHQKTDRHRINQIYALQFVTDPLRGVPPEPLKFRRAARNAVMRQITQALRDLHR